jgi:hypothetical protein
MPSTFTHADIHQLRAQLTAARDDIREAGQDLTLSQNSRLMLALREKSYGIWQRLDMAERQRAELQRLRIMTHDIRGATIELERT